MQEKLSKRENGKRLGQQRPRPGMCIQRLWGTGANPRERLGRGGPCSDSGFRKPPLASVDWTLGVPGWHVGRTGCTALDSNTMPLTARGERIIGARAEAGRPGGRLLQWSR